MGTHRDPDPSLFKLSLETASPVRTHRWRLNGEFLSSQSWTTLNPAHWTIALLVMWLCVWLSSGGRLDLKDTQLKGMYSNCLIMHNRLYTTLNKCHRYSIYVDYTDMLWLVWIMPPSALWGMLSNAISWSSHVMYMSMGWVLKLLKQMQWWTVSPTGFRWSNRCCSATLMSISAVQILNLYNMLHKVESPSFKNVPEK